MSHIDFRYKIQCRIRQNWYSDIHKNKNYLFCQQQIIFIKIVITSRKDVATQLTTLSHLVELICSPQLKQSSGESPEVSLTNFSVTDTSWGASSDIDFRYKIQCRIQQYWNSNICEYKNYLFCQQQITMKIWTAMFNAKVKFLKSQSYSLHTQCNFEFCYLLYLAWIVWCVC